MKFGVVVVIVVVIVVSVRKVALWRGSTCMVKELHRYPPHRILSHRQRRRIPNSSQHSHLARLLTNTYQGVDLGTAYDHKY